MIPRAITAAPVCSVDPLIERCRDMGTPVWRFDGEGRLLTGPETPGVLGLWLRSSYLTDRIGGEVARWAGGDEPGFTELFPGCWLLPIPEIQRRRTVGYVVAMALGSEASESDEFARSCSAASIDQPSARRALLDSAPMTRDESQRTHSMLRWMHSDLEAYAKGQTALETFTTQLSEAYETIHTIYEIGRSMSGLGEPDRFVELVIDRVQKTLEFGWVAALISPRDHDGSPRLFLSGETGCDTQTLLASINAIQHDGAETSCTISPLRPEDPEALGPQIVTRTIGHDGLVFGLLAAGAKGGIDPQVSSYETLLLEAAGGYLTAFLENVELYEDQRQTFMGTIQAMTAAIDAKDRYTCGHSERVAYLSAELARAFGLDEAQCERIHVAGLVHDVGKIGVAEQVLCKPGRLTDDEFAQIREHPEIGQRILAGIPALQDILPGVMHHHERIDGKGYPHGLIGENIPLMARIIGVADTFDAMSSTRSYRPAMNRDQVLGEMRRVAGSQLDPELVDTFMTLDLAPYDTLVREHAGPLVLRRTDAA